MKHKNTKTQKHKNIIFFLKKIFFISFVLIFPVITLADGLVPKPSKDECKGAASDNCGNYQLSDIQEMLLRIFNLILQFAVLIAFIVFIYGGFMMLLSAGRQEYTKKGVNAITNGLIGLIITFSCLLIVDFILKAVGYSGAGDWSSFKN